MKLTRVLLLASILLGLVVSLQLSSHRQQEAHEQAHEVQDGPKPYYPKHYLGHRSEAYKKKVREENLKKIEGFNSNNKKKFKSVGLGLVGSSLEVTGGNSFVMGETKFIDFTQEEFIKLFTGLNRPAAHHHHEHKTEAKETHQETAKPKSHRIFENHLLSKVNADLASQMQSHDAEVWSQNQEHNSGEQHQASSWTFVDPYLINDNYLDSIYGNVNSDSNWGWDWKKFDNNYYSTPSTKDYSSYWKSWEDEHWGFDYGYGSGSSSSGLFGGWSLPSWSSSSNTNSWWNNWSSSSTNYQNNDSWWSLDSWFSTPTTPSKPNNPTPAPSKPNSTIIVQPTGPVQPNKPSNGTKPPVTPINNNPGTTPLAAYPKDSMDVNWVIKGGTTHIKEQGQCGSCWTFSAIGVVEAYLLIKGLGRMDLSEQQLVDCERTRSQGCNGGFENHGLGYAAKNGLVAEEKYPYKGYQQKCVHTSGPHKIPKYINVSGRAKMQEALRKGPITGAVYVDDGFQFYQKGIFDKCVKSTANHAVVIVGFNKDYWIIRNSWGTDWGEDGHIRVKRDQNNKNACSIEDEAYGVSE